MHTDACLLIECHSASDPPAQPLKQAAPVVQCRGIPWLNVQCPGVIADGFLILMQLVMAECAVVVGPAMGGVEVYGGCVVQYGSFKLALDKWRVGTQAVIILWIPWYGHIVFTQECSTGS